MQGGTPSSEPSLRALDAPLAAGLPAGASAAHHAPTPPRLSGTERQLLFALMLPGGPGTLPDEAHDADPEPVVTAAAQAGLALTVARNARAAGLDHLAHAAVPASQRQRFEVRAQLRVALDAARRLREATGAPPLALGALAAAHLVHASPDERLAPPLRFLVAETALKDARRAVRGLPRVIVTGTLPGVSPDLPATDAVWLRAGLPDDNPWRLPSLEDLALTSALLLEDVDPVERLGLLADVAVATRDPALHLESVAQRATLWDVRDRVWRAFLELRERLGVPLTDDVLRRVRPSAWARLVHLLFP